MGEDRLAKVDNLHTVATERHDSPRLTTSGSSGRNRRGRSASTRLRYAQVSPWHAPASVLHRRTHSRRRRQGIVPDTKRSAIMSNYFSGMGRRSMQRGPLCISQARRSRTSRGTTCTDPRSKKTRERSGLGMPLLELAAGDEAATRARARADLPAVIADHRPFAGRPRPWGPHWPTHSSTSSIGPPARRETERKKRSFPPPASESKQASKQASKQRKKEEPDDKIKEKSKKEKGRRKDGAKKTPRCFSLGLLFLEKGGRDLLILKFKASGTPHTSSSPTMAEWDTGIFDCFSDCKVCT
jgi:hypothetical protein